MRFLGALLLCLPPSAAGWLAGGATRGPSTFRVPAAAALRCNAAALDSDTLMKQSEVMEALSEATDMMLVDTNDPKAQSDVVSLGLVRAVNVDAEGAPSALSRSQNRTLRSVVLRSPVRSAHVFGLAPESLAPAAAGERLSTRVAHVSRIDLVRARPSLSRPSLSCACL